MALKQNDVMLYVYGEEGVTEALPLGAEDRDKHFLAGAKDKFNVKYSIESLHIQLGLLFWSFMVNYTFIFYFLSR